MAAILQEREPGGAGMLAITLLLTAPSVLAVFTSYAILQRALYSTSALWFIYEISLYLGGAGAGVAVVLTVTEAGRRRIRSQFVWLMGIVAVAAVWLEWYAVHIYRSPWST